MKKIYALLLLGLVSHAAFGQKLTNVSGYVRVAGAKEALIGASVWVEDLEQGGVSNTYGRYSLSLPKGKHALRVSYLGYETTTRTVDLQRDMEVNFELSEITHDLSTVTITANKPVSEINEFNFERIDASKLKILPKMFGEADAIKSIQLLSGIKTLGDGSSGMFIRGGGSDQNLILLDEAPIYNPSHVFGYVSAINADALNNITLYKSNAPAQYGGRASAVLDTRLKEGNLEKYQASLGASVFMTSLEAEGPIVKGKSSFLVSARKSLIEYFSEANSSWWFLVPSFYDLNVKANTILGKRDRLYVSLYHGFDKMTSDEGLFNQWRNTVGTLRWNRIIRPNLFSNVSLIMSRYHNSINFEKFNYQWNTGVNDVNLKWDLSLAKNPNNEIKLGLGSIYHLFTPGESNDKALSLSRIKALEHVAYISHDYRPLDWLGFNYGLRLSIFQNIGPAHWVVFDDNHEPTGQTKEEKGVYKTYWNLEPRFSANVSLRKNLSLKLAYARNAQYMQVLQNSSLSYTSLETWFPANPNIRPLLSDVASMGAFDDRISGYSLSLEAYYKWFTNQIDFIDHAQLVNNIFLEGQTREGTARAYGAEVNIKKNNGRLTGNLSYTYSRAFRKIGEVNEGREYRAPYDMPHDLRLQLQWRLNKRWDFSAVWLGMSGRTITVPVGFYDGGWVESPIYSERNGARVPANHRLDVAINLTSRRFPGKPYWVLSAGGYNIYSRRNVLGYQIFTSPIEGVDWGYKPKFYPIRSFGILPSLSFKLYL